ncbi:hypothetical protein MPC1_2330005 [Methylocella tundrae]|nr:hypothetical protein MPC1_2330005 [Methylocella tundrae]
MRLWMAYVIKKWQCIIVYYICIV